MAIFNAILERLQSHYISRNPIPFGIENCGCMDINTISRMIFDGLMGDKPFMVSRFGSVELNALANGLNIGKTLSLIDFIKGKSEATWWTSDVRYTMKNNAGFFPCTDTALNRFVQLVLDDAKQIDILGSWIAKESLIDAKMKYKKVRLLLLEPYWAMKPWSLALKNKKVLVVHPFAKSIISQYTVNREKLFENPDVLPEFASLTVIQAVQSIGGNSQFCDWFEALAFLKDEIDKTDYDIALIGCGAYGMSLAAHCKRMGKKAVHIGGALQLLFGIKGARWENPNYGMKTREICPRVYYNNLFNDFWVRPKEDERPDSANNVEGGCYW